MVILAVNTQLRGVKDGIGTDRDEQKAFEWYMKSAENGNINGQYSVAMCYKYGLGTEVDKQKAVEWFLKSDNDKLPPPNDEEAKVWSSLNEKRRLDYGCI